MYEFWRRIGSVVTAMDRRSWLSLAASAVLLGFVTLMFLFGQDWLRLDRDGALTSMLVRAAESELALPGVVAVYCLLSLTGFPQILLFVATVIAFGPQTGAAYAWIATMASATLTFLFGRVLGGSWVRKVGGEAGAAMIGFLGRRGVLASGLIRVVPSAPFIVVNAAAGAARIPLWKYWLGTGVGIVPKILLIAVIAAVWPERDILTEGVAGVVEFFRSRRPEDFALVALLVALWVGFLALMRAAYVRMRRRDQKIVAGTGADGGESR